MYSVLNYVRQCQVNAGCFVKVERKLTLNLNNLEIGTVEE